MKTIEVISSPALYDFRATEVPHTTVVTDILRATTSICAAFKAGVEEIVPLDSLDFLNDYSLKGYLLAAERFGKKIGNAQCGNSPVQYLKSDLSGKKLAYSSTNGTVGILKAWHSSKELFVGCFSNLSAVSGKVNGCGGNVVILCSGWKNDISLEDTLFAGALTEQLITLGEYEPLNDSAHMALDLYRAVKEDLYEYCLKGSHIQRLLRLDCEEDVRFALTIDSMEIVPRKSPDGALRL